MTGAHHQLVTQVWEPLPVAEVARSFAGFGAPWWIAGGIAIELAVGRVVREHADVDVVVLRAHHQRAHDVLAGWELWAADPPGTLRPWPRGEALPVGVHDVWCRRGPGDAWRLQLMIDESDGGDWVSRHNASVRRPLAGIVRRTPDGVPFLVPEVQLHLKARRPRPKDEVDFDAALPVLDGAQRSWLRDVLPAGHPWQARLGDRPRRR